MVELLLIFQSLWSSDGGLHCDSRRGYCFQAGGSTRGRQVPSSFLHISKLSCSGSLRFTCPCWLHSKKLFMWLLTDQKMVQLKVRMLLCDTGNRKPKSKYMFSLALCSWDHKAFSHGQTQGLYGCTSIRGDRKINCSWITEVFWCGSTGWWELKMCLLLTRYCDTQ